VLILPVIILGGIYGGYATPTEAGAIAALYSFVVPMFVLRETKFNQMPQILKDAARITAQLFILITCSTAFAQATTMARLPQMLTESFANMDMFSFLLMLNVLLLIVGCFFDASAAVLILAPLLMPTAGNLGIDPVHLGIVFCVNLSIGMFTPPFGLNIYVVQSVLRKSMTMISRSLVPFIILYIIGLLIITYVPQISLFLPALLM
jgi:C4-dicarboxylate transporter DctM subunit